MRPFQSGTFQSFLDLGLGSLAQGILSRFRFLFTLQLVALQPGQSGLMSALGFSSQTFVSQVSAKEFLSGAKSVGQGNEAWADHIAAPTLDTVEKMETFNFSHPFRPHLIMEALGKKALGAGIHAGTTSNAGLLDRV